MSEDRWKTAESALRAMAEGTDQESFHCNNVARETLAYVATLRTALTAAEAARDAVAGEVREKCAKVAANGCLVPPDGGEPTDQERELCEDVARYIRALELPTPSAALQRVREEAVAEFRAAKIAACQREALRTCGHPDLTSNNACVQCAYALGRRLGQVEAGAYWTLEEAMARLRDRAPQGHPPAPQGEGVRG